MYVFRGTSQFYLALNAKNKRIPRKRGLNNKIIVKITPDKNFEGEKHGTR